MDNKLYSKMKDIKNASNSPENINKHKRGKSVLILKKYSTSNRPYSAQ